MGVTTTIGYGSPNKADTAGVHGAALGEEEAALTRQQLGWDYAPFEIPRGRLRPVPPGHRPWC